MIRRYAHLGVLVLLCITAAGAGIAALPAYGGAVTADDISFAMPPGWIAKEAPGMKAYQVLMYQGNPVGEMYLAKEPLMTPKTPTQLLEEGLRKNAAGLQNYQSLETLNLTVAGCDAALHDYVYSPPQSPVPFTGRVVVFVVNNAAYTFFFNTTSNYFPAVKGSFAEIVASVRVLPRPSPVAATQGGAQGTQAGPRRVEEDGFVLDLGPGWRDSNDAMGAKYRYYGADGGLLASFFPFGRDKGDEGMAIVALIGKADPLDAVLAAKVGNTFKTFGEYAAVGTRKRKIAGCDAIVHDFSFRQGATQGMYRWCIVAVKDKPDTSSEIFAPSIYHFAFMTSHADRFDELKTAFDAVLDSMKLAKPLPGVAATASPDAGVPVQTTAAPSPKPADQELPSLDEPEGDEVFRAPNGKFTVQLPKEAKRDAEPGIPDVGETGDVITYKVADKPDALIILHLFEGAAAGPAYRDALTSEWDAKDAGETTWTVDGRKVPVDLFTTPDGQVLVTAVFANDGLFLAVRVPKATYGESRGWIKALIGGVRFGK